MASLTKRRIKSSQGYSRRYYITWYESGRKRFLSTGKSSRKEAERVFVEWKIKHEVNQGFESRELEQLKSMLHTKDITKIIRIAVSELLEICKNQDNRILILYKHDN